jgi:hypothetical protein
LEEEKRWCEADPSGVALARRLLRGWSIVSVGRLIAPWRGWHAGAEDDEEWCNKACQQV